jgi:DNA polymerase-3 subunit epsilon
MIHQLFNLSRPLFVLDCETTGIDTAKDRIVEIGFQRWTAEGMDKEWRTLVNPGVPIPEVVTAVHGITDALMKCCRKCSQPLDGHPIGSYKETIEATCIDPSPVHTFAQLAANLAKGFTDCDFAGKNVRFDLRILAAEMARAGVEWSYANARIIDAERLEQLAVPRTLSHLHEKYTGAKHDGAHGALSDVRASATVIVKQLEAHAALPRDLTALHALQWPGWLCDGGQFKMIDGVATCCFGKKWNGRAMKDIEVGYYDWIISAAFPEDVKAIAREAKLGRYPTEVK